MKITVCKDCNERYLGCHGKCEKYINQVKEETEKKEKITNAMKEHYAVELFERKQVSIWKKRKHHAKK